MKTNITPLEPISSDQLSKLSNKQFNCQIFANSPSIALPVSSGDSSWRESELIRRMHNLTAGGRKTESLFH